MKRWMLGCLAVAVMAGCQQGPKNGTTTPRLELKKLGADKVQFIPVKDQLPYCLIFTRAQNGPLRLLTMTRDNKSPHCPPGQPVQGVSYRIPPQEGAVKVLAFFSDQRINAGSIAQQLWDQPDATPMNLRLPGNVMAQTLDFVPSAEAPTREGEVVGSGGQISAGADGGVLIPSQPVTPPGTGSTAGNTPPKGTVATDAGTGGPDAGSAAKH